jgi:hypothetical protein
MDALLEIPRIALQVNRVLVPVYILVYPLKCRLQPRVELPLWVKNEANPKTSETVDKRGNESDIPAAHDVRLPTEYLCERTTDDITVR